MSVGALARRIEREQVIGELGDRLPDPLLGLEPFGATKLAERRPLGAGVAGDASDLLDRDEDPVVS